MTRPQLPRLAAALFLAGLGAACKKHTAAVCELPAPQPSAFPATAGPGQSQAIHFGSKTTGDTVTFDVPPGTAGVSIVLQAASSAVPLTLSDGSPNTPVPLRIDVAGNPTPIFHDVPMPPDTAFPVVDGLTVLDPLADPNLAVYFFSPGAWTGTLTLPSTSVATRAMMSTALRRIVPPKNSNPWRMDGVAPEIHSKIPNLKFKELPGLD